MVIDDLDAQRLALAPHEAKPPLVADADAVLPRPVALQGFQAVARRYAQIVKPLRRVQRLKLGPCPPLDLVGEPLYDMACEQGGRALVGKAFYHLTSVLRSGTQVNEQSYRCALRMDERDRIGRRKGFGRQYHNHKDAKTRIETGFGGCFGELKGFEAMVTIP